MRHVIFALFLSGLSVFAAPVSYIFRADVAGVLGTTPVSGPFTLIAQGDTTSVALNGNAWSLVPTSVTITIGGQDLTLNAPTTYVFDNVNSGKIGFGVNGLPVCCDIIQQVRPEYDSYNLQSSIGPLAAAANLSLVAFGQVPTSGGLLTITTMESNTFQAIVAGEVPEPGAMALLASGFGMLVLLRRRA